ncbi:MAG: tyrosyl-tRNA synthetase [Parcubacteria group bacterium Gr01-1014_70]|nr:MAG: tyrosyl-tRNA synthetase [Parcubacteria group bacterium Gr01-1014_70]
MPTISTNKEKIAEVLTRSVESIYPTKQLLEELLLSGKQIKIYVGIDPTADYVHIGHSTNYLVLERFHRLGHKVIVLVGDFTARIGDPSDKTAARTPLSKEEVEHNLQSFKTQIGKILDFENKDNPIDFVFNSTWLSTLDFGKLVELASQFTVQHMLERDMFQKRMREMKPLYVHEFFYPLLQGYDSVALGVDLEVGGTDQTFNMLAGRTLVRRYLDREKFVLTTPLLVHPKTNEKLMSKSAGTGIGLHEAPDSMFGKVMALPDESMPHVFRDCTRVSLDDINQLEARLQKGENPRDIKRKLAYEITALYHGEAEAKKAEHSWTQIFSDKKIPDTIPEVRVQKGTILIDVLVEQKFSTSKTEARRLCEQGAVEFDGSVIQNTAFVLDKSGVLRVGKKVLVRIVLE